jgi:hypothetical protein
MLRSRLFQGGLTGSISSDLTAVCNALKALETQTPQFQPQAQALAVAFTAWLRGNHPGELSVLQTTAEFKDIQNFVARYQVPDAPPPFPPRPAPHSPLKSIGVALFTVRNGNHNFTLSLFERQERLWTALKTFSDWLGTVNQAELQLDNPFRGIFVAPEYYFTKPNPSGVREFLDLTSKRTLDLNLQGLSRQFPKILLVPGTIHYEVEMTDSDKVSTGYQLLQAAKNRILRENALANPKTVLTDTMSLPQYGPAFTKIPTMNELADNLLDPDTKPRKIHNVTCLLLNGTVWGTYDKHTDFFEAKSISPDQSMFVPGTQDECPVIGDAVRKYRFGVEICFDHGNGVLMSRKPANLHFHIVVSDSVPNQTGHMAMKSGGYFLHASTDYRETVVRRRGENGQLENSMPPAQPMTWGPDFLDFFLIKLPMSLAPPLPPRRV